jgi:hypothetical protein
MKLPVERFAGLPTAEPRVETCWALVGPTRRPITCAIYQTDVGLEVRVGYTNLTPLCARRATEMATARTTAESLRDRVNARGVFEEVYEA